MRGSLRAWCGLGRVREEGRCTTRRGGENYRNLFPPCFSPNEQVTSAGLRCHVRAEGDANEELVVEPGCRRNIGNMSLNYEGRKVLSSCSVVVITEDFEFSIRKIAKNCEKKISSNRGSNPCRSF